MDVVRAHGCLQTQLYVASGISMFCQHCSTNFTAVSVQVQKKEFVSFDIFSVSQNFHDAQMCTIIINTKWSFPVVLLWTEGHV